MGARASAAGIAAACALACAAGCTPGGDRPLAPVAPVRPSAAASRVVLSPKTGRPVSHHPQVFSTGVEDGRAWRVRAHALEVFDVHTLRTTRFALPGPVSGHQVTAVDVSASELLVAVAGLRDVELYRRHSGRWRATDLRIRGRLQQPEIPDVYLSERGGVVAVLANYVLGMTVAQNFLFLSSDAGARFRRSIAPPGLRAYNVSFLDREMGFAVEGSIGVPASLFRTDDAGRSWHGVRLANSRSLAHRALLGRPVRGPGGSVVVPVEHGDNAAKVTLDLSTDGGRTFRATRRSFAFTGPARGGLPWGIGLGGGRRAVADGGHGLVATVDGHTWHHLSWFRPQDHRLRDGKYAVDLLGTPGGRHVFVQVSGYPNSDSSNRPQPWTFADYSSDRGRTWHARSARHGPERLSATHAVWADRRDGWAYGPGLFATTNGGRTWHHELLDHTVFGATLRHDRLTVIAQHCEKPGPYCRGLRPNRVFTVTVGHSPRPSPAHPLPAAEVLAVSGESSGVIDTVIARYRKHRAPRFDVERTTQAGTSSHRVRLPTRCAKALLKPEFDYADGTLWFACQTANGTPTPQFGPVLIYQSHDNGRTWVRTSGSLRTDLEALSSLTPTDGHSAWAVTDGSLETGGSLLWHTSDGGHAWRRVRGVPRGATIDALTTPTSTSAVATVRVVGHHYASIGLLRVTRNGRHTHVSRPLPVPTNLPR
ncbi:MAG TPA: hypothetical protein VGH30_04470 [Jatrophihabitantaceae bacterium]